MDQVKGADKHTPRAVETFISDHKKEEIPILCEQLRSAAFTCIANKCSTQGKSRVRLMMIHACDSCQPHVRPAWEAFKAEVFPDLYGKVLEEGEEPPKEGEESHPNLL